MIPRYVEKIHRAMRIEGFYQTEDAPTGDKYINTARHLAYKTARKIMDNVQRARVPASKLTEILIRLQ